ncbi:MAG: hypothetical protein ABEJ08_00810 [Halobacteriaceae archaeon]
MTESDEPRTRGLEFNAFGEVIATFDYPVTCAELVEQHGEHEIGHVNGSAPVAEVLGPIEATFESAADVRATVIGMVGIGAIGRKRYTDRGGTTPEEIDRTPLDTL